jgi:putative oxidoreductase
MFDPLGLIHLLLLAVLLVALYGVRRAIPGSGLQAWHDRHTSPRANARWHRVLTLEIVELALAGIFLLVGGAKLIGRPDMVELFHQIGVGQWFRYVTGAVEIVGAALLLIPILSAVSASLLGGVMIVATLIELFVLHRPPVAALACLSGHAYVTWARMSGRHHRWLEPEDTSRRSGLVHSTISIANRWNFRRINASRRVHRQPALRLGE